MNTTSQNDVESIFNSVQERVKEQMQQFRDIISGNYDIEGQTPVGQILLVFLRYPEHANNMLGYPYGHHIFHQNLDGILELYFELCSAFDNCNVCFVETPVGVKLLWTCKWDQGATKNALNERMLAYGFIYDPEEEIIFKDWNDSSAELRLPQLIEEQFRYEARKKYLEAASSPFLDTWEKVDRLTSDYRRMPFWDEKWRHELTCLCPDFATRHHIIYGTDPTQKDIQRHERLIARIKAKFKEFDEEQE